MRHFRDLLRGCEKSVRKRHQGVFFSESQGVSLEVDSDCVLGSTENRISGSNPSLSASPSAAKPVSYDQFSDSETRIATIPGVILPTSNFIGGPYVVRASAKGRPAISGRPRSADTAKSVMGRNTGCSRRRPSPVSSSPRSIPALSLKTTRVCRASSACPTRQRRPRRCQALRCAAGAPPLPTPPPRAIAP